MNKFKIRLIKMIWFFISLHILFGSAAIAAEISAVNSSACKLLAKTKKPFILVLKKGEKFIPSIIKCANDANILSASLNGLGSLVDAKLGYFDMEKKQYKYKIFSGPYELISLNGNITRYKGKRVAHLHVILGDLDYHVVGGHLDDAKVGATAEITVIPLKGSIIKKISSDTGLPVIQVREK